MATWRGSTAIQEDPNSPEIALTKDGRIVIRTYNGPYLTLDAAAPARGTLLTDGIVDDVNLKHAAGDKGVLVVKTVPFSFAGIDSPSGLLEIEWLEVQKKLETHARYRPGGAAPLTNDDLDRIEDWRNTQSASDRASKFSMLSTNAQDLALKINRGQDSFVLYAPIARQTLRLSYEPISQPCGVIQSPPPLIAVSGYQYLKTADRVSGQNTHWEQIREWTGANFWDSEIYPYG